MNAKTENHALGLEEEPMTRSTRGVFQQLGKLSTTALYILLRECEPLRTMSMQKLAKYLNLTNKTLRWYLEELSSYGLIRRVFEGGSSRIVICENPNTPQLRMIDAFAANLRQDCIRNPFEEISSRSSGVSARLLAPARKKQKEKIRKRTKGPCICKGLFVVRRAVLPR